MTIEYLKTAKQSAQSHDSDTTATVQAMLAAIRAGGEERVREYARTLDGWHGPIILGPEHFSRADQALSEGVKADIRFAHRRITDFAQRQRDAIQ